MLTVTSRECPLEKKYFTNSKKSGIISIVVCEVRLINSYDGVWLSLVERCVRDAKVAGSNPVTPTIDRMKVS